MSWDSYMDTLSTYTEGKLKFGGIFGTDGTPWTVRGENFNPAQQEILALKNICDNNEAEKTKAQTNGVFINGQKYRFLRIDPEEKSLDFTTTVNGKLHNGNTVKTTQAVLVCITEEEAKSSVALTSASKLANYLKQNGY